MYCCLRQPTLIVSWPTSDRVFQLLLSSCSGANLTMPTSNGRRATRVATPFHFLDLIIFYLNFETMNKSIYMHAHWWGSSLCLPITHKLAPPLKPVRHCSGFVFSMKSRKANSLHVKLSSANSVHVTRKILMR